MGTGISAILLHQMPYTNVVFETMGTVLYVLNVLLFVTFILMTAARYLIWPGILPVMLKHEGQSLFLGTLPMGFATLVNLTVFIAVPAFGQRYARQRRLRSADASQLCAASRGHVVDRCRVDHPHRPRVSGGHIHPAPSRAGRRERRYAAAIRGRGSRCGQRRHRRQRPTG